MCSIIFNVAYVFVIIEVFCIWYFWPIQYQFFKLYPFGDRVTVMLVKKQCSKIIFIYIYIYIYIYILYMLYTYIHDCFHVDFPQIYNRLILLYSKIWEISVSRITWTTYDQYTLIFIQNILFSVFVIQNVSWVFETIRRYHKICCSL